MSQAKILNFVGSIGGVGGALSSLASALGGDLPGGWKSSLRQASYRGVPFAILAGETTFGRKNAVHQYPQRDGVWVEDLGRSARVYHLNAFLVENSLVYGGGGVVGQRERLIKAFELGGDGELVHPTLGRVKVSALEGHSLERWDAGRFFELSLTFIEAGERRYPAAVAATTDALTDAADEIDAASIAAFIQSTADAVALGAAVVQQAVSTALGWYTAAVDLVHDVKRFFGAISTLAGNFGRLFGGGNSGYSAAKRTVQQANTVGKLIANDAAARTSVTKAGSTLTSAAASVTDGAAFGAAAQGMAAALAVSAVDPADRIRLLSSLIQVQSKDATSGSEIGAAMATMQTSCNALFRRVALTQVLYAVGAYQPTSADDAASVREGVSSLLEDEILAAADDGDDDVYQALIGARQAVIADLNARGGNLATVTSFAFPASVPALSLAQRIYRDASRSDDLVKQADPVHPAFMPTTFNALSS
ncbi:DNA circularization protein [Cupriavidus pauculus]|uniref:DNA circularization protein n=1 Tax=Cupriavidus pauculus TaxID=82633 RepID=UPI001EE2C7A2|nr:DNA circularization N-terminal domain-containing protein [Cupriavidus pauculus]GJG92832.1 DNA circulation family protein [Cupriavidus pauculus]